VAGELAGEAGLASPSLTRDEPQAATALNDLVKPYAQLGEFTPAADEHVAPRPRRVIGVPAHVRPASVEAA
jgi:hypothetical protein